MFNLWEKAVNREKIVDRVKKLFALAENNPSQEEAISATLKAQKLMLHYNIHEEDLLEELKEEINSVIASQSLEKSENWRFPLAVTISKSFRCKAYKHENQVAFRGYKGDAEIALQTYLYLYKVIIKLTQDFNTKSRNSFIVGFLFGVKDALDKQCRALSVITPEKVENDWKKFTESCKLKPISKPSITNSSTYQEGYEAGMNAVESNKIEEKTYA